MGCILINLHNLLGYSGCQNYAHFCSYYTGQSLIQVKIEADNNDITEQAHDDKPRPYSCRVCGKRYTARWSVKHHEQLHAADQVYTCSQCEKQFATQHCLSRHMNVRSSKYKCTECEKCFSGKAHLTARRRIHFGEKPMECTICCKQFTTSGNLVAHSRIHSGKKSYMCLECDKAFSESGACLLYTSPSPRD